MATYALATGRAHTDEPQICSVDQPAEPSQRVRVSLPDEKAKSDLAPESEVWRRLLLGTDPSVVRLRRRHRRIPSPPRCKMCAAPFGPPGGWVLRYFGHARWAKNPKYCEGCFRTLQANHGGAEVDCSLLFADVRGSTLSPRA